MCNKFAITDWNMKVIASGLYLLPSMFNHSCTHNCEVIFDGLQLSIHTIKHVKCDEQVGSCLSTVAYNASNLGIIILIFCSCLLAMLTSYSQKRNASLASVTFTRSSAAVSVAMERMRWPLALWLLQVMTFLLLYS